jgi:cell division protein FtsB
MKKEKKRKKKQEKENQERWLNVFLKFLWMIFLFLAIHLMIV